MPSATWSTRANGLTLLRLLAAPALVASVYLGKPWLGAALFVLAVATDLADGWVARRYRETSPLGALIDHGADALFVTSGSAALALRGELPVWLPVAIAFAFTQYVLDSRPAPALRGSPLGRWNGIAYFVAVGIPIVRDALGLTWPSAGWVRAFGWLLIASTLASVVDRLRRAGRAALAPASSGSHISDS
jgi:phosphatidylglycerophosphate synthase